MIRKTALLTLHRWVGLAACGFILLQALTGTLLVFRGGLAEVLDPAGMTRHSAPGAAAPLSAALAAVQARYPGGEIQRVVWPQNARGVYFVHLADREGRTRYASVDPGDGELLRAGGMLSFPMEAVLALHFRLAGGKLGLALQLFSGLALITMAASGLAYWWPKAGRWKTSLKITWGAPLRMVLRQAHRAAGATAAVLCLASGVTGVLVAGEYLIEPGPLTSVTPHGVTDQNLAGIDRAFAQAVARRPEASLRDVRLPGPGRMNAFFWAPERSALAVDGVKTSLPSGAVTGEAPARAATGLWVTVLPWHTGETFGLVGRLLLMLGGVAAAALSVTGPILWLQRRR